MRDPVSAVPELLNDLYEQVSEPTDWPGFLSKFANAFRSDTATIRLTDMQDPVVYQSYVSGFRSRINDYYESEAVNRDPFKEPLANTPLGAVLTSHNIMSDRAFERTDHYQYVFRPNGNFYAMGTQFERNNGAGLHVGVHRPWQSGPYTGEEARVLELIAPHLRRVTRLTQLMTTLNEALAQANQALNQLPFGVWHMDAGLRIQWINTSAEEALAAHTYGLGLSGNRLLADTGSAIKAMAQRLTDNLSPCETLKLNQARSCLVMTPSRPVGADAYLGAPGQPGILCFLLDACRPSTLNLDQLTTLYQLTHAECRLACLLVSGLDVAEASAALQISPHTGRTQLKSIMHKTGTNRQASLQRKLLLGADMLRNPNA
ncbi:helix-turn-helix transcriptional regulator [Marinobacter nauticus]|uniref:HTH luxR-type domain-containing protein n=1 Tax=Marinobacter nauticus TaxID=2743 RepID=A0A1M2UV97_MARNT|nr:hypothetical protein [Marinobacter nauticus]OJS99271.1 hypothetical protein BEE62_03680 [Marinobacter nauticus]